MYKIFIVYERKITIKSKLHNCSFFIYTIGHGIHLFFFCNVVNIYLTMMYCCHTLWQVHYAHTDASNEVWHAIVPD